MQNVPHALPREIRHSASPFAQETFYVSRHDKHSDWFCHATEDTVMAVAADSHRDFLIPEKVIVTPPTTGQNAPDEPCLFFCVLIVSHRAPIVNPSVEKCKKTFKNCKFEKERTQWVHKLSKLMCYN